MGSNLPVRSIRPRGFYPTQPRSGNVSDDTIYRLENMIIQGEGDLTYALCYAGTPSLSETIATSDLTGTIAVASGSTTVTGTGTTFTTELNPGQYVIAVNTATHESYLLVVRQIISDTSYTCWKAPTSSMSGMTGKRMPVIFAVDQDRGTQIFGNTLRLDRGTLLSVGQGTFRVNGTALSTSLTATRSPQIGLFDSEASTYTFFTLGMDTPVAPTAVAAGGGTKGMQAGIYSMVATPERTQTLGYNNPSPRADVTIATDDKITATFGAMDTANGQNAWGLWVTRFADTLGADLNYLEGPWYRLGQYTGSAAGFAVDVEWLDAEVERNDLITFDNDAAPDANFVVLLNNIPVWISCQGTNGSSPGPFIFPSKPGNIEAAPAVIAFSSSPPETILGVVSASGRAYLLTTNHLQIFQATPQPDIPVLIRPFWTVGFTGPDQLVFVNDTLYGHSVQGPARSAPDGVPGSEEFDFAVKVSEITDSWISGHVKVSYDPGSNGVPYIHSVDSLNSSGFWTTRILLFGLRQQQWISSILFSSTTQDMIVCGAAMVGNSLQLLIGGRLADDSVSVGTYTFNVRAGVPVPYYIAPPFTDYGSELRDHCIKRVRVTAKNTSASLGVFGAGATESIPVTALETGNSSSLTGAILVTNSSTVVQSQQYQVNVPNVSQSTLRFQGIYNGTDAILDQVHELVVEACSQGIRR